MRPTLYAAALCAAGLAAPAAHAQSLRLGVEGHAGAESVQVRVGDVIRLQIIADFQSLRAAGLAAYITVPEGVFLVRDLGLPGQDGTQPFRTGPMFDGAQLPTNRLLPDGDPIAATIPGQQLDLATLFGLGSRGEVSGEGVVATFEILALSPTRVAVIDIDDSPIREPKIVLSDGRTERRFATTQGLRIIVVDPVASPVEDQSWGPIKRGRTKTARYLSQAAGPW